MSVRKWSKARIEVDESDLDDWTGEPPREGRAGYMRGYCPACKHHTQEPLRDSLTIVLRGDDGPDADSALETTERTVRVRGPEILMENTRTGRSVELAELARTVNPGHVEDLLRGSHTPSSQQEPWIDVVHCRCGQSHDGRDDDKDEYKGCGRYWLAQLTNKSGTWKVEPADPSYWPQAVLLDELESKELTDAKASAEAWATAMVALLGILGISTLVLSREVARSVSLGWRWVLFALLLSSVLCAWRALTTARKAASGLPATMAVRHTESGLKTVAEISRRQPEDIGELIKDAQAWAGFAAAAVAAGIAVLWFAGPAKAELLVQVSPNNICGALVDADEMGLLSVRRAEGMDPQDIELSKITRLDIVENCP